ncbi:MAG: response regulator transcription factor [Spirochaetaceae bacterium]|jgi:two-component system response regulator RegX3|nr:response regulator transcription factor [Spirochaetaceae bacterium]
MQYDCLIIDDEQSIGETVKEYFTMFEVKTAYAKSRTEALAFLEEHETSLILLDINLGEESGFMFCKELRSRPPRSQPSQSQQTAAVETAAIPIIFISVRSSDDDILAGLAMGGDDYITKPFSLNVLLAKVKAMLRRIHPLRMNRPSGDASNTEPERSIGTELNTATEISSGFGDVEINRNAHRVSRKGEEVKLKPLEFRLLCYLLDNKGRVISKDELLSDVWQGASVSEGTLSVHIRHLREKLEADPDNPVFIKTVWGVGYIMETT